MRKRWPAAGYPGAVSLFDIPNLVMVAVSLAMFIAQVFAFVDAMTHRPDAYAATDKLTKTAWLIILGLGVLAHLLFPSPLSLFNLVGIIAALVYLLDVRPALKAITSR